MFMSRHSIANRLLRGSVGLSPVFAMVLASQPSPLAAATIPTDSLANACAGVSLPPSVVTNLLTPVINGVVSPLQSGVNGLLSVLSPKLNIDTTSLLNNAASGQPISVKLLNSDGTIVGSNGSCFSQASGFTLSGTSGISIGGNQITGLGSGATANAGEVNSIAFGNNAVTAPTTVGAGAIAIGTNANIGSLGAAGVALGNNASVLGTNGMALGNGANVGILGTGSVALGNGASATTANSVAIGAGSVASRIVLPGGASEVSIGAPGSERQLTNLAAGTATTDAVNLGQLNTVAGNVATNTQNIATLTTNVGTNTQNIATLQGGLASATASVGQLQTGLAATNTSVGTLQSGLTTANANIGSLQTSVTANTAGLSTANSNIASLQGTVASNGTAIGQLQTGLATTNGTVGALQTSVNANTAGLTTANTNIASLQGTVAANGTAIGQLQTGLSTANGNISGLQTSVAANTAGLTTATNNIAGLQTAVTANTSGLATATSNIATLQGAVSTNTANLAANVADVATLKTNVATNTGNIGTLTTGLATATNGLNALTTTVGTQGTAITANASAIDALHSAAVNGTIGPVQFTTAANPLTASGTPTNDVALVGGTTGAVTVHNVGSGSVAVGSTDAVNGGQLATVANQVGSLANLAVQYDDPTHTTLSLGGTGSAPVVLANVKAGALSADSTQAVNGSQLLATNNAVALNGTQIATLNGQVGQNSSAITGLQGAVQTNTGDIATVNANLSALSGAVGQNTTNTNTNTIDIGNLTAQVNTNTGLLSQQGSAINANANALVTLRNDTANGAIGPVQYSNPLTPTVPNGGTPTNDLTLVGRDPTPVKLHNVADGVVAAGSKDGVNGGQLFVLSNQMGSLSDLAVQYDDATKTSVTLSNALGGPAALKNIQAGTLSATSNDAVNGSQLFTTNQSVANIQTSVDNQGNQLATLNTQVSNGAIGPVQYSSTLAPTTPNGGVVSQDLTLVGAGSGPVGLHNVAQGTLSATSTDAVNGSQLFATNNQISSLAGLSVQYDNGQHSRITLGGPLSAPVSITNVANGQVAAGSTDAVNGGQLFTLSNQIGSLSDLAVQYDDPTRTKITLASALGTPTTLSGIAPATLSATSTDAVNGAQLYTTNQTVAGLQTQVTAQTNLYQTLGNQYVSLNAQINNGAVGPVRYSDPTTPTQPNGGTPSQDLTLVGAANAPVALHNVAPAVLSAVSTDAVNGSQLFATNLNVSNIQTSVDAQGDQLTTLDTQVTQNTTNLGNLTQQVTNGGIGPVQYSSSANPTVSNGGIASQDLTLVGAGAGAVGLHNLAAGTLSMTSLDAVNGSQLVALGNATANIFGGNYAYNPTTNSFAGNFNYGGNSYASIQSVLGAIQSNVQNVAGSTGVTDPTGSGIKYFHTTSTMTDSTATGSDSTAIGPTATSSGDASIAVGRNSNAMGGSSVAIGDGATAQNGKAVSIGVGNIASGNGAVSIGDPNTATGEGASALGKDNTATGDGAIAMGNTSTAVGTGAVALGNVSSASGDGSVSLGNMNSASGAGSIAIGSNNSVTGVSSLAIGSGIETDANDTLAIGNSTVAADVSAVALGNRAQALGLRSLSVGTDTSASGEEASSYGTHSHATGDFATALGADSFASGQSASAIGYSARAVGALSAAFGSNALANGDYTLAVGEESVSSGEGSMAVGHRSQATGFASTALGSGAIADQDGSVALGTATQTVRGAVSNYSAFGLSGAQTSLGEIAVARNISYYDPNNNDYTPTGNRQITGVAAGSADTDAVNVSQLRGVSSTLGTAFATGLGGGAAYNGTTGSLIGPSYTLGGVTYTNVGDALQALAANGTGTGSTGGGTTTPAGNSVTYNSDHSAVTLASSGTTISNVAAGEVSSTSTDAVNGSQLNATNEQVSQLSSQVSNGAIGVVRYANAASPTQSNGGTQTNDATLVGANAAAPVALHNVASGSVSEGSTDAVNGGQLYATNQAVSRAQSTADTAMTMSANSVQYDSSTPNSVTLGNAASGAVALHNVADGQSPRDAVNVGQMNAAVASAVSQANGYTDGRIAALSFDLRKVSKDANAGTAGAMALAGMPQPYEAGKGMISMAMATYQGQSAVAFGASKAFNDGHTVMKVGATYNSSGAVGASAGIGYQF
jgi:autotransporter adhesin